MVFMSPNEPTSADGAACPHAEQEVGLEHPNPPPGVLFIFGVPVYAKCLACGLKKGFMVPSSWSIMDEWPTLTPEAASDHA